MHRNVRIMNGVEFGGCINAITRRKKGSMAFFTALVIRCRMLNDTCDGACGMSKISRNTEIYTHGHNI